MPVASRLGRVVSGVGMTGVAIDGQDIAALVGRAGGGCFRDDGHVVFQECVGDHCLLAELALDTGEVRTLDTVELFPDGSPKSLMGANAIVGGGGVWAAWLARDDRHPASPYGYRDSLGRTNPGAYPVAVDDASGVVFLIRGYYGGEVSHGLWAPGSDYVTLGSGWIDAPLEASFRSGVLTFAVGGRLAVWTATAGLTLLPHLAQGIRQAGGYLIGWSSGPGGLVIYPLDDVHGLSISTDGRDFDPDLVQLPDGTLFVPTSMTQGGRGQDLRRYVIDMNARTVNGVARPLIDITATPAPASFVDEPSVPLPTIAPFVGQVGIFDEPGAPLPFEMVTVLGGDAKGPGDVLNKVRAALPVCRATGHYLLAYADAAVYPPSYVPRGDEDDGPRVEVRAGQQMYPHRPKDAAAADDVALTKRAVTASVQNLQEHGHVVEIVLGFYRQIRTVTPPVYNWRIAESIAHIAAGIDLGRETGVHAFWGFIYQRGFDAAFNLWRDGVVSRTEFSTLLARLRAAAQTVPAPPPAPRPAPVSHDGDLLMSALTLKRSKFADGSYAADRGFKVYPLGNGNNLSIDIATGEPRPNGLPNNGPSESFLVKGDRAFVDFDGFGYSFLVVD